MDNLTLPARLLAAAQHFAPKNDVRYYLNGIHIDPKGFIDGTDGATLFRAPCKEAKAIKTRLIVNIKGKIPIMADMAHLVFLDDTEGFIYFTNGSGKEIKKEGFTTRLFFMLIDGAFPNIPKVLPKGKPVKMDHMSFNPLYMARVGAACKSLDGIYPSVTASFYGEMKPLKLAIKSPHTKNAIILIMPVKE